MKGRLFYGDVYLYFRGVATLGFLPVDFKISRIFPVQNFVAIPDLVPDIHPTFLCRYMAPYQDAERIREYETAVKENNVYIYHGEIDQIKLSRDRMMQKCEHIFKQSGIEMLDVFPNLLEHLKIPTYMEPENDKEIRALDAQIAHPSFTKTRLGFQKLVLKQLENRKNN